MEQIQLILTIDEANLILAALGQQPYLKVADLIQKIQRQGAAQMQEPAATEDSNAQNIGAGTLVKESNGK